MNKYALAATDKKREHERKNFKKFHKHQNDIFNLIIIKTKSIFPAR